MQRLMSLIFELLSIQIYLLFLAHLFWSELKPFSLDLHLFCFSHLRLAAWNLVPSNSYNFELIFTSLGQKSTLLISNSNSRVIRHLSSHVRKWWNISISHFDHTYIAGIHCIWSSFFKTSKGYTSSISLFIILIITFVLNFYMYMKWQR